VPRPAQSWIHAGEGAISPGWSARCWYRFDVATKDSPTRATDAGAAATTDAQRIAVRCFRLMKNLTADGYYTSRAGLLDELRYPGNTAMLEFPPCVR
jgi:hypothetical protein